MSSMMDDPSQYKTHTTALRTRVGTMKTATEHDNLLSTTMKWVEEKEKKPVHGI